MILEVFFDYSCPFCLKGHRKLLEVLPDYSEVEILWRPCEAHPRPETFGPHSDLCARAMLFAKDTKVDLMEVHERLYKGVFESGQNIEDIKVVASFLKDLVNEGDLMSALEGEAYKAELAENNRLAWVEHNFPAVPSFCMGDSLLPSIPMLGLTKKLMRRFLDEQTVV